MDALQRQHGTGYYEQQIGVIVSAIAARKPTEASNQGQERAIMQVLNAVRETLGRSKGSYPEQRMAWCTRVERIVESVEATELRAGMAYYGVGECSLTRPVIFEVDWMSTGLVKIRRKLNVV